MKHLIIDDREEVYQWLRSNFTTGWDFYRFTGDIKCVDLENSQDEIKILFVLKFGNRILVTI